MSILVYLIPISVFLGLVGLGGFIWTLRTRQYDDPEGDSRRILSSDWDDRPRPDRPSETVPGEDDQAKR